MSKAKKIGIVLILIGFCLPLVFLSFVSEYHLGKGFIHNIQAMKIVLRESYSTLPEPAPSPYVSNPIVDCIFAETRKPRAGFTPRFVFEDIEKYCAEYEKYFKSIKPEVSISYKYIFALGVVSVFTGIGFIVLSKSTKGVLK